MNLITPRFDEPTAVPGNRSANLDMTNFTGRVNPPPATPTLTASSRWRLALGLFQHETVLNESG
jgi:hypothetical protein